MRALSYLDATGGELEALGALRVAVTPAAAPLERSDGRGWPLLVLSHGLGVARAQYSALSADLASHGFVVVALDHPMGGFTETERGEVLRPGVDSLHYESADVMPFVVGDWARDIEFVVRRVIGRADLRPANGVWPQIDTAAIGAFGHSLGGAAALESCRVIRIVRACADMDGDPWGAVETQGVGRPFLVLLSQPDTRSRPPATDSVEIARRANMERIGAARDSMWRAIGALDSVSQHFVVKIVGTGHMSFSDAPFVLPSLVAGVGASRTAADTHRVVSGLLRDFFFAHLIGEAPSALRAGLSELVPP